MASECVPGRPDRYDHGHCHIDVTPDANRCEIRHVTLKLT